jgi:pyruvate dehydrogenase E2 component (dihydrolipoamide acetyltransferase)
MVQALRMPMMGNTMETGLLAEWRVAEGDPVEPDQVVAVVESEKAAADVVANREGTLARVDVEEGEEVPPGTLIGVVLGPDEDIADAPPPRSRVEPGGTGGAEAAEAGEGDPGGVSGPDPSVDEPVAGDGEPVAGDGEPVAGDGEPGGRAFARPSTRRLARELGVDLGVVEGAGAGGRVTESDVRRAAGIATPDAGSADAPARDAPDRTAASGIAGPPPRDPSRFGVTVVEERELSGVRRTVAERMSRSAREAPQVTLNREVAVGRAFETVDELSTAMENEAAEEDAAGVDVGFVDLLVGAAVRALERHPEFNAWYEGETLRLIEEVNVAVAVDAGTGLLTPVVRGAGRRTLDGIARERRRLTGAVLEGRHGMDDLQGGTFTVSNLGPLGVDSFDPILDPPQVAILGVGRVHEEACTLSLTFDHRVVDGADAARFLDTLVEGLESPSVVVAERAAAGDTVGGAARESGARTGAGTEPDRSVDGTDHDAIEAAVASDLAERAREVAAAHDWPVPGLGVRLDGERPAVVVRASGDASPATLRRIAYAACRESRYAATIAGLRDPDIELRTGGP